MSIKTNLEYINKTIADAAIRSGRKPEDIMLLAVTKTHEAPEMNEVIDCGVENIGENKVQEITRKYDDVKPAKWHLIGHLQTNKVKYIIDKVEMIHSVDSLHLAQEIDKRAKQHGLVMKILVQVNVAEEESKFGITSQETDKLINDILENCPNVKICGIMCIAPFVDDEEEARPYFREAKQIYDSYLGDTREGMDFKYLSMGMSNDYEVAIEEGSNLVRVGTAIFGARDYSL
ncbi:MAG: YggS family pyridoxal phosphate-dependent enzyme [Clostridia bacterium]|nr:YggS family pyridoxal phosphate-dependent enzyme [Clostridia bacterium]